MVRFSPTWVLHELRRRRVFNTVAIYIVGAWVALQVSELAFPALDIPERAIRYVWLGAFLLFPLVLVFGWRYDLSKGGIKRTPPVDTSPDTQASLSGFDRWLIGGFSIVALAIVATMLVRIGAVEPERIHFAPENSIAVLPFEVCGGHAVDKKLGFQLPIEILNRLSEHPTFKVIAQTSSYKLAGFGWSKPRIAKQLGVEYILSGEVCRDGKALTITAELRDKDDFIKLRETYAQAINDFDQIEHRVATQVADSVATELGDVVQLAPDAPLNRLAYEQYLIALEFKRRNDFDRALIAIEKVLVLQPDFAMAILERAFILVRPNHISHKTPTAKLESLVRISEEALGTINRQLETGKNSGRLQHVAGEINLELGHLNNAWIIHQGKMLDEQAVAELKEASMASFQRSERHHRSSIALRYPNALSYLHLGDSLEHLGGAQRRNEALQVYERGLELDPFNRHLNIALAKRWSDRGRYRQGIELLERFKVLPDVPDAIWWWMGEIHADHGYLVEYCELNIELLLNAAKRPGLDLFFFIQVLEQLGLKEEADEWYARLRKVPGEPEWRYERYLLHTEQQDQIIEKRLVAEFTDSSDEAMPLLEETVKYLEAEYNIGIRHPQTLYLLAEAYAHQGRGKAALDMLEKAVDYHARWPVLNAKDRLYSPWDRLKDDPHFIRQWDRMEADLQQQAESIRAMLAQYDIDELLTPIMAVAEETTAETEK